MFKSIRAIVACTAVAVCFGAAAQEFPSRPVKVIVPYAPGGVVDVVTRSVTDKLAALWQQPVVVEPKPGANGYIGADAVKNAPADGYTLLTGAQFVVVSPVIDPNTRFRHTDFTPVAMIGAPPNVFVVPASLPVKTLKDFVAYAKARPGKLNTAQMGIGGSNHLGMETFMQMTGIDVVNVGYKGAPPMIPDLVSGQLHIVLAPLSVALPSLQAGKIRALAVNATTRISSLPDVPTLVEAGFPAEAVVMPWFGLMAPKGTPPAVVERINISVNQALADPVVQQRLKTLDTIVTPMSAAGFAKLVADENVRWIKLARQRNITAAN